MNRLARVTLAAYPRSFRQDFGPDYLQAVVDLRTHGRYNQLQIAGRSPRRCPHHLHQQ